MPSLALKMYFAWPKFTRRVGSVSEVADVKTDTLQVDMFMLGTDDVDKLREKEVGRQIGLKRILCTALRHIQASLSTPRALRHSLDEQQGVAKCAGSV